MQYSHSRMTSTRRRRAHPSRQPAAGHTGSGGLAYRRLMAGLLVALVLLVSGGPAQAESIRRDLTTAQEGTILGASLGLFAAGRVMSSRPTGPVVGAGYAPNRLDYWVRDRIHGREDTTSNFLDNHVGSALAPMAAMVGMGLMDINRREFSRDIPFFLYGIAATKGVTDLAKSIVGRPRPYCIDGGCPPPKLESDDPYHQRSFFSGHTSAAFYSATFFNKRFRRHMRQNWTPDEYKVGRTLSPIVAFGWASLVGLSRIHADKHFFTDVAAGALAGALIGELYFHLAYETDEAPSNQPVPASSTPLIVIRIPIQ